MQPNKIRSRKGLAVTGYRNSILISTDTKGMNAHLRYNLFC